MTFIDEEKTFVLLVNLLQDLVKGNYQEMINQNKLRGIANVIDEYIKKFPGMVIMPNEERLRQVRGIWEIESNDPSIQNWMVAINLWFLNDGQIQQGDLIVEILYTKNSNGEIKAIVYNII